MLRFSKFFSIFVGLKCVRQLLCIYVCVCVCDGDGVGVEVF